MTFEQMGEPGFASYEAGWSSKHRQGWRNTQEVRLSNHRPLPVKVDTASAMRVLQQPLDGTTFCWHGPRQRHQRAARCEAILNAGKARKLCSGENPFDWKTLKHLLPAKTKIHKVKHHPAVRYREFPMLMENLRARTSISARRWNLRS